MARRVEGGSSLDAVAGGLGRVAGAVAPARTRKSVATGTWLGHALHPVLTDFADGAWMAASFLDVFGPEDAAPAARRLVGFGLLAAVPTAATGLAEWADTGPRARRVGAVHAVTSTVAFSLYGCSYLARRRGRQAVATVLGVAGGLVAIVDGYVGGHLSLVLGVGVDHTAFERRPADWTALPGVGDLPDDGLVAAAVDGVDVVVARTGGRTFVLSDRCSYRGAPLHEGRLEGDTIVCARHGCTFRLADGSVVRGPASIPQPTLEVRVADGGVEVRGGRSFH